MAKTKISEYSSTANSNTDIASINIDEGCAPSGINNAIRALMAQLKNFQTGADGDSFNGPVGSTTRSTGAFTSISATGDITIDNGNADGGQLLLASSGYSNWGVDNYSGNFRWYYNTTEKMRLDNSGNLGLGVTPSAWNAGPVFQIGSGANYLYGGSSNAIVGTNSYYNSGWKFGTSAGNYAVQYQQVATSGQHQWFVSTTTGTTGNAATLTQAMTLFNSGTLTVGDTQEWESQFAVRGIGQKNTVTIADNAGAYLRFIDPGSAEWSVGVPNGQDALTFVSGRNISSDGTERARIDSSGNLLVGTTDSSQSSGVGVKTVYSATAPTLNTVWNLSTAATTYHLYNTNATNNGYRFYVATNGGISNYSGNNVNLSDERTKTNIEVSGAYLDKICAIPVKLFNYKDEPEGEQRTLGVIAQDVEAVAPELVNVDGWLGEAPEGEEPLKSIYTTDMMFALMKCIQEQQAIITQLTSRIEALEQA